jgi:hypothetical protein
VSFFLDVLGCWRSVEVVLMEERDGDRDGRNLAVYIDVSEV